MNRLQSEMQRLYLPPTGADQRDGGLPLVDAAGGTRALVLELSAPADPQALGVVWQGVQVDLELPAPAIAVSGTDGIQLWFSLAAPVPTPLAMDFLDRLRARYLSAIKPARVRCMPCWDDAKPPRLRHSPLVPAPQDISGRWSAFVSPDLAPMFAETPWLDMPPGADGQASLLAGLDSIRPEQLRDAMAALQPAPSQIDPDPAPGLAPPEAGAVCGHSDPRRFLLEVMNNESVALALRVEAAKALLPQVDAAAAGGLKR